MHQTNRLADGIDEENGAAIGDINAEAKAALVCDQTITTLEAFVLCGRLGNDPDAISVHLLRGNEWRGAEPVFLADLLMNAVQSSERFRFIMRHLDAGDTQSKTMNDAGERAERRNCSAES